MSIRPRTEILGLGAGSTAVVTALGRHLRGARNWWPRPAGGLPPGQRALDAFPRFADDPLRPPPSNPEPILRLASTGLGEIRIGLDDLRSSPFVQSRVSDFHCVTTWTARQQTWTGVPLADWWRAHVGSVPTDSGDFAVVRAADGYQAVFLTADLFSDDVMLAWGLNHAALDRRHGFPLRLVSPSQYGYKNVKHVETIELCAERPAGRLGPKEHLRARVALEERHSRIPGRLLRWPYRLVVPITAVVAERTLDRFTATNPDRSDSTTDTSG
ncbi:MAG: molybdopterin-dependent oxidoreductase [Kineosporiaceae bacterium]